MHCKNYTSGFTPCFRSLIVQNCHEMLSVTVMTLHDIHTLLISNPYSSLHGFSQLKYRTTCSNFLRKFVTVSSTCLILPLRAWLEKCRICLVLKIFLVNHTCISWLNNWFFDTVSQSALFLIIEEKPKRWSLRFYFLDRKTVTDEWPRSDFGNEFYPYPYPVLSKIILRTRVSVGRFCFCTTVFWFSLHFCSLLVQADRPTEPESVIGNDPFRYPILTFCYNTS